MDLFSSQALSALLQVFAIDLVLAGDNAVVIGVAAATLPAANRGKVIFIGILSATVLRIIFAVLATEFLRILGLLLAGGILLLWVAWKLWRDLRRDSAKSHEELAAAEALAFGEAARKSFWRAVGRIVIADLSMSLDNVLAVAGAARDHPIVLAVGLVLSIALMGLAASLVARVLERCRWLAYIGLAVILYVAVDMIYRGALDVWPVVDSAARGLLG